MDVWPIISVGCHMPCYAPPHLALAGVEAGSVATEAEHQNMTQYRAMYLFVPLAIETSGAFDSAAAAFFY